MIKAYIKYRLLNENVTNHVPVELETIPNVGHWIVFEDVGVTIKGPVNYVEHGIGADFHTIEVEIHPAQSFGKENS